MKFYQVYITSTEKNGKMNRFSFSSFHLKLFFGLGVLLLAVFGVVSVDYSLSVYRQAELKKLRLENRVFKSSLENMSEQVQILESNLEKIEDFSTKLKFITRGQSQSPMGIGPLPHFYQQLPSEKIEVEETQKDKPLKKKTKAETSHKDLETQISFLQKKSTSLFNNIWNTLGFLEENKHLLKITPSVIPTKGWISSRYGYRNYPVTDGFSSLVDFHGGLDIASPIGTPIIAPADGFVLSTGSNKRTGNYITLNHGYQLKTLYGHLNEILVRPSQKVSRGDVIGTVGNTGRSTGSHLHYEIRIANESVNPEYYILD